MKKLIVALFSVMALFMFMGTGAFAAESTNDEILHKIDETNVKIEEEIQSAQEEGDDLLAKLSHETAKLDAKVEEARQDGESEEELAELENEVKTKKAELTSKYNEELDKLIGDLIERTNKMTADMIEEAAEEGIEAECSWVYVQIADRWVWVDPIKIIGP
ncbi:hypothetical protein [Pseudalkalibacillus hwajinpoensis]|uniref:DUF3450 domain-containing protein n=1 Tax=Guptibacillus hwajinpoensis TaxID=208199 RepID=A0A4U1MGQ1_9BACL|nr:hypothetical protein [Pseudalkalibacillus hwajinpoensis]TKD70449.1 hypothetical protein FBF83_07385 [Pseudalkalibacillus hwajinpoensis]